MKYLRNKLAQFNQWILSIVMPRYTKKRSWQDCPVCQCKLIKHTWRGGKDKTIEYTCNCCNYVSATRTYGA
jgi:hypothetical protein